MIFTGVMTNQDDSQPDASKESYLSLTHRRGRRRRRRRRSSGSLRERNGEQQYDETKVLMNNDSYFRRTTGREHHHLQETVFKRLDKQNQGTRGIIGREAIEEQNRIKKLRAIKLKAVTIGDSSLKTTMKLNKKLRTIEMCHLSTRSSLVNALLAPPLLIMIISLLMISRVDARTSRQEIDSMPFEAGLLAASDEFMPMRKQPATSSPATTAQQLQSRSGERAQIVEPKRAESSSKFTRMNELDVFLDDMNHNELRAVATGKPIGDYLFQARPLTGAASGQPIQHERLRALGQQPLVVAPVNSSSRSSTLDESQSEQQIYSECALILQRTYVKNIENPKHQLLPFGKTEQACISYKHIDKAIEQAKHLLKFKELTKRRKKQKPKRPALDIIHKTLEPPQDLIAAIGELNMATTQILANQFDLSNDELLNGLPLIDMSKTKFWPLCPALVKQDIKCEVSRYRTLTGHCNNLKHPTWGAAMTPFARYLPPVHPDGIWIPRKSVITETIFDISPASPHSMPAAGHHHEPSQPRPVFGDPHLSPPHSGGSVMHLEHLSSSASVQFVSHVRPEDAELASMMQQDVRPSPPQQELSGNGATSSSSDYQAAPQTGLLAPSIYKRTTAATAGTTMMDMAPNQIRHYHESHSPMNPYVANSFPMRADASGHHLKLLTSEAQHHHHRGHQARSVALDLPSARLVTSIVHRDVDLPHHDLSILFMSWGQLLDHDMTRAAQSPPSIKCCTPDDGKPKHKLCLPIQVPHDDPFYAKHNVQCLEFRRTLAGLRPNCVLGPRVHQNAITSPIDANFVYGSSQAQADSLRLFKGGRLRDRNWFQAEGLKPLLPAQDIEPDLECIARPKDLFCFLAGDVRVNEQTHLTVLHTIYMREHNRMVDRLADLNPHWDDERLFQEARHIMAAGVQHAMINEYLPLLIGQKMADLYNLTAVSIVHKHHQHQHGGEPTEGLHWHGYDASVTTSVANSFAAAAFRQGHTFVQGSFERYNKFHEFVSSERLRHLFKRPFLLYQPGVLDELVAGMINQASQSYDPFISEDISGHLFQPPELAFGHDLAAINLQRGREQGLPGYNLFREWCGLPRAETFDQLEPYLTNHTAFHYSRLYKHVDDIDLWSGGVSERKLPGAAIGPTFACIIARQFSNTRRGDRFWYENPGLPSSFTPRQLMEIRKITLAKLLCANSDDLPTIQRWALRLAHPVLNPRLPCDQLPQMDLRAWKEE